jgi:RND family efflux transporter MFP subunit
MKKSLLIAVVVAAVAGGAWYYRSGALSATAPASNPSAPGSAAGAGGRGGRGAPSLMTVETAVASRHDIADTTTVVGNLIGEATVDVVPRVAGRIESIAVRLGDRVTKGQQIAKIEDRELREQINQAEASLEVNMANVEQRQNDVAAAKSVLDRTQTSFDRGIASKQNLEDAQTRYASTLSQVSVTKAQVTQTQARIDELKITLSNTTIVSPVDGFVSRRNLDPGAFAGANTPILSVVDISTVRMVANIIEKDFRRVQPGVQAMVEVDAFPGEQFTGEVSRVAPVFDPATRTAPIEIEVPNPGFRLKPGLYARVKLTLDHRKDALTVPRNAVVDAAGKKVVYVLDGQTARLREIGVGMQDGDRVEVLDGLHEGEPVITLGVLAVKDGDKVIVSPEGGAPPRGGRRGRGAGASPAPQAGR